MDTKIISENDYSKKFFFENKFYLTATTDRLGKMLAHYELYKKIINLPGHIVEFGVFKGISLSRFCSFRDLLESSYSRKIIGFDAFGSFPETNFEDDKKYRQNFINEAGEKGITEEELQEIFQHKNIINYQLIKGDILETLPEYINKNPHLKIAFLHIDTDIYEPAKLILELLYEKVVKGGIIAFDDYGTFPGETKAADDFLTKYNLNIHKLSLSHIPAYIVKP